MRIRPTGAACVTDGALPAGAAFALSNHPTRALFVEVDGALRWLDLRDGDAWDFTTLDAVRDEARRAPVRALRASYDGACAALVRDGDVAVVRADAREVVRLAAPVAADVEVLAVLEGGARVVTASTGAGVACLYDGHTGARLRTFEGAPAALSLCGRWIAAAARDHAGRPEITVHALDGGVVARVPSPVAAERVAFSGDGRWLWACDRVDGEGPERRWRLWCFELASGARFEATFAAAAPVALAGRPYTAGVVIAHGQGEFQGALPLERLKAVSLAPIGTVATPDAARVAWSPDGRTALASAHVTARVDLVEGCVHHRPRGAPIGRVVTSAGGELVACAAGSLVTVLDARSLATRWRLEGPAYAVAALAFPPGARALLAVDGTGTLRAWDLALGLESWSLELPEVGTPSGLSVSPCGAWALVASAFQDARSWLIDLRRPSAPRALVGVAAFLPDEQRATALLVESRATASSVVVRVLDVGTSRVLDEASFPLEADADAYDDDGEDVSISRDGRFVIARRDRGYGGEQVAYRIERALRQVTELPERLTHALVGRDLLVELAGTGGSQAQVVVYDLGSGAVLAPPASVGAYVAGAPLALSDDEQTLFLGDNTGRLFRFAIDPD